MLNPWRNSTFRGLRLMEAFGRRNFLPQFDPYLNWLRQPLGWFVVAALVGAVVGAFITPQGWLVCAAVLALIGGSMAWPFLMLRGVRADLSFDRRRCREHDAVTVTVKLTNRYPWPCWGLLIEGGLGDGEEKVGPTSITALAKVAGWSQSEFEFGFQPPRRGCYPTESPQLTSGFPFGLWFARKPIDLANSLIVWPYTVPLRFLPAMAGDESALIGNYVASAGDEGDILASRAYRDGDSLRKVHWIHTARRDTLIVCERHALARPEVVLSLDHDALAQGDVPLAVVDWGVRIIASLGLAFYERSCDVSYVGQGGRIVSIHSENALHQFYEQLALYRPLAARTLPSHLNHSAAQGYRSSRRKSKQAISISVTYRAPHSQIGECLPQINPAANSLRKIVLTHGETTTPPDSWFVLDTLGNVEQQLQRLGEVVDHVA